MNPLPFPNCSKVEKSNDKEKVALSTAVATLVGDKAYSSALIRQQLRRTGTTPVIPKRSNEKKRGRFNRGLYP